VRSKLRVARPNLFWTHQTAGNNQLTGSQQWIHRLDGLQFRQRAVVDFEICASMAHQPSGAKVQKNRAPAFSTALDGLRDRPMCRAEIESIGEVVFDSVSRLDASSNPVGRTRHRNADAIVLADHQ